MLERYIRDSYQRLLVEPLAKNLREHPYCAPFKITIYALISGLLVPLCLYFHWIFLSLLLILFSGYCDTLDGTIARLDGKISAFGSVLDIVVDRIVEASIVFGLYLYDPAHREVYCLFMLMSILICVTSFLVVSLHLEGESQKGFRYSEGLIERAEAFIFFIAMILFPTMFNGLALMFILLVTVTAFIHVGRFYKTTTLRGIKI